MTTSLYSIRVICVVAAVGLSTIPLLQAIGSYNNVEAQFQGQPIDAYIHIDKGSYSLGEYGVIVSNDFNGDKRTKIYFDSVNSPSSVVQYLPIRANDGDKLIACAMKMSTQEIACDAQYAQAGLGYVDFYIDMNTAKQLNDQAPSGGYDQAPSGGYGN